jgi:hypothetical protein
MLKGLIKDIFTSAPPIQEEGKTIGDNCADRDRWFDQLHHEETVLFATV